MAVELDETLSPWEEIRDGNDWSSLLVGNGFSQNVWQGFRYQSLYETALQEELVHRLNNADIRLFQKFETHNFEAILSALSTALAVETALERNTEHLVERYESIRLSLIDAVHHVHLPWLRIPEGILDAIATAMSQFESVYSSNYDLIMYWALMRQPVAFKDFFWGQQFDISNTEIWGKSTKMHFLHGGLHLYRKPSGETLKRQARLGQNLLDLFGTPFSSSVPLFVSEGSSEEKKTSIYRSDYLSFLFSRFAQDSTPLVIFGQSLGESDKHLVEVLEGHKGRKIAVSILPTGEIMRRKAELIAVLPDADFLFFDATTFPLGSADIRIPA